MTASIAEYVKYAAGIVSNSPPNRARSSRGIARRLLRSARVPEGPHGADLQPARVPARSVARPILRRFRTVNSKIYNVMQGPETNSTSPGTSGTGTCRTACTGIKVPTLLIAARHDEMSPEQIQRMGSLIPDARVAVCPKGSHMALYDDQQAYFDALVPFLREAHGFKRS